MKTAFNWHSDSIFTVDGEEFVIDDGTSNPRRTSEPGSFTIVKGKPFFDFYERFVFSGDHKDVFELGIFQGGSTVLLDVVLRPDSFVALDKRKQHIDPLEDYIERKDRGGAVEIAYGVSQADRKALREICDRKFPNGIDLVSDDASHIYEHTKTSFEELFPRLRPGGLYVIEDWSWSLNQRAQKPDHYMSDRPALANLIFELVMLLGSPGRDIQEITLYPFAALIRKGSVPHSKDALDLSDSYLLRGREFHLI